MTDSFYNYSPEDKSLLHDCTLCPRDCHVDRFEGGHGYCSMNASLNIASICIHKGEEPVIGGKEGICNIFFAGCNLHCIYCQNHEISQPYAPYEKYESDLQSVLVRIERIISQGIPAVGFVSPSHMVPQMKLIIDGLHSKGLKPVIVYNTNGYDKVETIKDIAELIDVYLPDYKYVTSDLSHEFSGARDYPEVALGALKEMYYQKGSTLRTDDRGRAENGMLIRHLVLPGHAVESMKVLDSIAEELSTGVNISLMSQYHPSHNAGNHPVLSRSLYRAEYQQVVEHMHKLGFRNGWIQDLDSYLNYRPNFSKEHPFEPGSLLPLGPG